MSEAVKVTIKKNEEEGTVVVECSHEIPSVETIAFQMPPVKQRLVNRYSYRSLSQSISRLEGRITYQEWSDAIAKAILHKQLNDVGATTEMRNLGQGAYMTLGNALYKLSPVELIQPSKAVMAIRKRTLEAAKIEAKALVDNAQVSANALIVSANKLKLEAKRELDLAKNATKKPPEWAVDSGMVVRYDIYNYSWQVRFTIKLSITHFDINVGSKQVTWDAVPQLMKAIKLWVPIMPDGGYNITSVKVDADSPEIPHIDHVSACMSPGDAPKKIANKHDLTALRYSIERCMQRVQLDSLKTSSEKWIEIFKDALPVELYESMKSKGNWTGALTLAEKLVKEKPEVAVAEELGKTWTAATE